MIRKIAVLGAGNGGYASAAELTLQGYDVTLFEIPRFEKNLEPIRKYGGILISGPDNVEFAKIPEDKLTTDIRKAVAGADLIKISVICAGQREIAKLCTPHLEAEQTVLFDGEPGGALEMAKVMKEKGVRDDIVVGETNTLSYLAEKEIILNPTEQLSTPKIEAYIKPGGVFTAAFPGKDTPKLMNTVKQINSHIKPVKNVLETISLNFNIVDHILPGLLNVAHLEGAVGFHGYWFEGITPSVARCFDAIDHELLSIRKSLGFETVKLYRESIYEQGFLEAQRSTTYEAVREGLMGKYVVNRKRDFFKTFAFINDTICYSARLISSIGKMIGVETPAIDALITLGSFVCERDFWKDGRTAEKIGLPKNLTVKNLNRFLHEGKI